LYDNTQDQAHFEAKNTRISTDKSIKTPIQSTILVDKHGCAMKKSSCMMSINNAALSFTPHKNNEWEKTQ
jgi:hypothetical protein